MKTQPATSIILALLISSLFVPMLINMASAEPDAYTITINSDGSITSAPESTLVILAGDNLYQVTGSFSGSIVVDRSNAILDGQGCSVTGPGSTGSAIMVETNNVTVTNTHIISGTPGIYLTNAPSCNITGNIIETTYTYGISVYPRSENSVILNNNITGPLYGIEVAGVKDIQVFNNTVTQGNSGSCIFIHICDSIHPSNITVVGNTITGGANGIYAEFCANNTITNNLIQYSNNDALRTRYFDSNTISDNQVLHSTGYGLYFEDSSNNTINRNTVGNFSAQGINLVATEVNCTGTQITNNTLYETPNQAITFTGLHGYSCYGNVISGNNITRCHVGIAFTPAHDNVVAFNNLIYGDDGIWLMYAGSYNNEIYGNNIISNSTNVDYSSEAGSNTFSHDSRGNYYSDYTTRYPTAEEVGTTGVWDTPYAFGNTGYSDEYALVNPINLYLLDMTSHGCGHTSLSEGLYVAFPNEVLQVTALPDSGKSFINWVLDDVNSTTNPITITMDGNHQLDAYFESLTRYVSIASADNGIVTDSEENRVDGTQVNLQLGGSYVLTAIPNEGYGFARWSVNGSSDYNNPLSLTLSDNYVVSALFGTFQSLTVEPSAHGTVYNGSYADITGTTVTTVNGTYYSIHAYADTGYRLAYWLVDGEQVSTDTSLRIRVTGDLTIQAVFTPEPIYIIGQTGQDWTTYLHDGQHTGKTESSSPLTNELLWKFNVDDEIDSSVAVVDNVVYFGTSYGLFYAVNATTAQAIWTFSADDYIGSSPAVADGVVYFGSDDGYFYALNAANGDLLWSYYTDSSNWGSPIVVGDVVYFGATDGTVYAFDATTTDPDGHVLWQHSVGMGGLCSSIAVDNGMVYCASYHGYIYGLDADTGDQLWSYWTGDKDGILYSSPSIANDVLYVASYHGSIWALNATTGDCLWENHDTFGLFESSTVVGNDAVYIADDSGNVYAYKTDTTSLSGELLWQFSSYDSFGVEDGVYWTAPALANGVIYLGSTNGLVCALNATTTNEDGELLWYYITDDSVYSSPVVSNGVLYAGSYDGYLYAFAANQKVTFTVSGLEDGDSWSVTFDDVTQTSTSDSIVFAVCPTGDFEYTITLSDGYSTNDDLSGTMTLDGGNDITNEISIESPASEYTLTTRVYIDGEFVGKNEYSYPVGEVRDANYSHIIPPQYTFDCLSIDGVNSTNPYYEVTMNQNHTVILYVHTTTFQLTIESAVGGSTTPIEGVYTYHYGVTANITASAVAGYHFNYWLLDREQSSINSTISLEMIANYTLTPVFAVDTIIATKTDNNATYNVGITGGNITATQFTNMTITPYASNTTTVVAFTVTGPSGDNGTGTIAIPKEAIPYGTTPLVYIDGILAEEQSCTEDSNYYYVTFSTHFSTHEITIQFTGSAIDETPITQYPHFNSTSTTTNQTEPSITPTPTPEPTTTPTATPTATPTTPSTAGNSDYLILIVAAAALILVVLGLTYRHKKHHRWN